MQKREMSKVKIVIYDILAERKSQLFWMKNLNAGEYEVKWNGSIYPSGVYFYKIITKEFNQTRKMILVK